MMLELAPWQGGRSGLPAWQPWAGQPPGRAQPSLHSALLRSSIPYSTVLPEVPLTYQPF